MKAAVGRLTDSAQVELMNAISCALAAVDSPRDSLLRDSGYLYLKSAVRRIQLALDMSAGPEANTVPSSGHGQEEDVQRAGDDPGSVVECGEAPKETT